MAIGDISAAIDTKPFLGEGIYFSKATHVTGSIYMVAALQQAGATGLYVTTVNLAADGTITVVKSVRYSIFTQGSVGGFAFVNGDVWALVYMKRDGLGAKGNFVGTFTCDSAGNLGAAFVDTFAITGGVPTNALYAPDIIKVANATNIFAVASTDSLNDGWVSTLTINNDGSIDDAALDTWEFNTSQASRVGIWHRSGTVYMIAYSDASHDGQIMTFNIQDDGALPAVAGSGWIDRRPIGNRLFFRAAVFPISGDVYAFVWQGTDNDGYVNTREITAVGTINDIIRQWEFEPVNSPFTHALVIDDNEAGDGKVICAVHTAYAGVNAIHTFEISNAGIITESFIDEKALHATNDMLYPVIVDAVDVAFGLYLLFMDDNTADEGTVQSREIDRAPLPTVTTDPATGVGVASATLNGTLDRQGAAPSDCGFEWGLDTGYGTTTATQTKGTGETFSQALAGLQPGTTYHFRAFATNPVGTSHGADRSFTTALVITRAYALAREEL